MELKKAHRSALTIASDRNFLKARREASVTVDIEQKTWRTQSAEKNVSISRLSQHLKHGKFTLYPHSRATNDLSFSDMRNINDIIESHLRQINPEQVFPNNLWPQTNQISETAGESRLLHFLRRKGDSKQIHLLHAVAEIVRYF